MPFSKYDPHRPSEEDEDFSSPEAKRRALLLKYGWWITIAYTAVGFVFLGLFWLGVFP